MCCCFDLSISHGIFGKVFYLYIQRSLLGLLWRLNNSQRKWNKMQQCIKIFNLIFIWTSTCFGRHTAHHQEPKTALSASGFAYVEGCWTCSCWTLSASSNYTSNNTHIWELVAHSEVDLGSKLKFRQGLFDFNLVF